MEVYVRSQLYSIPDGVSGFSIKIIPEPSLCNCLHCRRYEWNSISNELSSYGAITRTSENEGYFDLVYEDGKLILETHESGPENFDSGRKGSHYYIKLRKYIKDELQEELLVKIDSNSADAKKIIKEILENKLKR